MAPPLSRSAVIVLRDLARADGKDVLKAAIKELIAAGVWRTRPGSRKRRRLSHLLTRGGESPPRVPPLPAVSSLIEAAPAHVRDGEMTRDLRDVAKHLTKRHRGIRKAIVRDLLDDLASAGLVDAEERRALGILRRRRYVRTEEGERRLADELGAARERRRGAEGAYVGGAYAAQPDDDRDHDPGDIDAGLDSSFDSGFDAAFDSSFDSAFDSGFSAGGGDGGGGGGGDGGGGGGGNGGGGGG